MRIKTYYNYNKNGFFIGTGEAKNSPKHEEIGQEWYMLPANATFTKVPDFDRVLEIPKFHAQTNTWVVKDLQKSGNFFLKADAAEFAEIAKKDTDLYTSIEPLKKYDDGTTQAFDDATQSWQYTFKGDDLLEAERIEALNASKANKIAQLEADYNAAKKITIQNGHTLVIKHDTPERGVFLEKLINVSKESLSNGISISYQQKVDNVMYRFSILPSIWSYIFKDLFLLDRKKSDGTSTGFKENSREYNKITFDAVALKIQNATTIEELNAISWNFANPDGVFINVNEKAEQMLNDSIVDSFTKSAINQLKDPETGEIHLINIV